MLKIENVTLYTGKEVIEDGAVLVADGKIVYAGAKAACPDGAREKIDGAGGILAPGFYNTHCHAAMTLERGVGSDLKLMDWLHVIWAIEGALTGEHVYWATQQAIMEMLRRGTVAFADMYFFMDQVGRAAVESGIRADIARGCTDMAGVDSTIDLYNACHMAGDGRVRVSMGIHAEYTSEQAVAQHAIEVARELGIGMHIHLSETREEVAGALERRGMTPVRYFDQLGAFDGRTIAAHCVHVDDAEIAILAQKGVFVAHNPASNLKLASGFARVNDMLKAGVKVALGTDGPASNNALDMLADMRLASILQKGVTGDPTALDARAAFTMATRTGALALGLADCGLIEAGMQADMILIDGDAENMLPRSDIPAALVYAAQGLNVKMTMVAGKVLYRDGAFMTLDKPRILANVAQSARAIGASA
ncbi:MAG: amidohydrolase [Clostridia bacterium]